MAARAIWKGIIRLGKVEVPVKLYSAVQDSKIHFRLLHEKDKTPVRQRMVNPRTGEPVPYEEIQRGYELESGEIVILKDEELQQLEPKPNRDIEILRFVDPGRINHQWYDRPYYLGPDGSVEAYFALAGALKRNGEEGVARWTMRGKEYIGALQAEDAYLKVITLHHAEEVVDASSLPRPEGRALEKQELQMAEQLMQALEGDFDPSVYRDEYRDRVLDLLAAKARGGTVEFKKVEEVKPEARSLSEMLRQSIARAREEKEVA
ncbi:MAG: Ku protein [Desulfovibrionales bacterium]